MHLLFVGNVAWDMWNFRRDLMLSLKAHGHQITVLAPDDDSTTNLKEHFNFIPIKNLSRKGLNPFRDLLLLSELKRLYCQIKPTVIIHYTIKPNTYGAIAAFLCNKPSISIVAGMGYLFTKFSFFTILVMPLYRLATFLNAKVIFLNSEDISDFKRLGMISKKSKKILLLPGEGINPYYFSPVSNFKFSDTNKGTFIFIGRLLEEKGIIYFLKVAKKIKSEFPQAVFKVLGPLDINNPGCISKEILKEFIDDGSISYLGTKSDIRPDLGEADALVLPTYYGEGMPRSILEAMSMNKPVITTENRGCKPLIQNNMNGYIVPMMDQTSLHNAIKRFLALTSDERNQMGMASRKLILEKFSDDKVTHMYQEALKSFL